MKFQHISNDHILSIVRVLNDVFLGLIWRVILKWILKKRSLLNEKADVTNKEFCLSKRYY
jgi:hypothetical protein